MSDAHRSGFDPAWKDKYKDQCVTAQEAVSRVRPGQRVFVGTGCAEPVVLVRALVDRAKELTDVEILHLLTFGEAPYADKKLSQHFRVNSFFLADNVRRVVQEGLGDYTPIFLSDIPRLFETGRMPLDVALIQVTPPDPRGRCSLGVSVDVMKAAARNAGLVVAQVNPRMPRTLGDSFLDVQDIDLLVEADEPLIEMPPPEPNEVTRRIGEHIASLVDDGSTLELGIGRIPHSVLEFLKGKRDLGIHTEMISDPIVDLVKAGAVTGRLKTLDAGKVVASFCMGTRKLFDFIHDNPVFSMHPTEYVNNPHVIARQDRMVAINVALEVDLTGQVCADSLGTKFFSGIGGQVDFNRGAATARGGKAVIALPSTARNDSVSRIVPHLTQGAGVVTTRGDVHYVVTEFGVAYLHGKSIQERAMALIAIAHPDFRASLLKEAIDHKFVHPEKADLEGRIVIGPSDSRSSFVLDDGTLLNVRPMHPTDEPRIRDLFYALSQQTIYYRFMAYMKTIPHKQIQNFVYIDHRTEVALAVTVPASHGEDIVAIGRYILDPKTNQAEVAFTVRDSWQNRGIGTLLLKHLIKIARKNGIRSFTAEVLNTNKPMIAVFKKSGCSIRSELREGAYHFEMNFPE
jgi:acyl-CoA hydrolase/RimJ/RimL family protein N-acetyltransferase